MKKMLSALVVLVMLMTAFAPMFGNILNTDGGDGSGDGDTALSDNFAGYTPISAPYQLTLIPSGCTGKYYLTNDIDFGNIDLNGGIDLMLKPVVQQTILRFELYWKDGSMCSTYDWMVWFDGQFNKGTNFVVPFDSINKSGTFNVCIAGTVEDRRTIPFTKYDFTFETEIVMTNNYVQTPSMKFHSNGNFDPIKNFGGIFDGNGHVIKGLDIRKFSSGGFMWAGLFENLDECAVVLNLGVTGGSVLAATRTADFMMIGGIAGELNGKIVNCYNENKVSAYSTNTVYGGGMVGWSKGFISDSYNKGDVSVTSIGSFTSTTPTLIIYLSGCYDKVKMYTIPTSGAAPSNPNAIYAGGIVGRNDTGSGTCVINQTYNTGKVTGYNNIGNTYLGGLIGYAYANMTTITDCYNRGDVNGHAGYQVYTGGIGGNIYIKAVISNCYSTGKLTAVTTHTYPPFIGGILAYADIEGDIQIYNCYYLKTTADSICVGKPLVDTGSGNSVPRKYDPNQFSGSKSATEMRPTLQTAIDNNSIYYRGTTYRTGNTSIPGWDFNNIWTIIPGMNDNYPLFKGTGSVSATISGTVTFNGAPYIGAVVTYTINGVQSSVLTGTDGKYSISVMTGDQFAFVSITSVNGALKYFGTLPSFTVTGDSVHNFALDYDKTKKFTVSGTVTFNGTPLSGAIVMYSINGVYSSTTTNSSGKYSISVYSGDYFVFSNVVSANEALRYFGTLESFRVMGDSVHNFALDYDTSKEFTVSGTITVDGTPIQGAVVTYTINGVQYTTTSNASGKYSINVHSGDNFAFISIVSLTFSREYSGPLPSFRVDGNSTHNFELNKYINADFTVSGTVTFNGNPLSGAIVTYKINGIQNVAVTNASGKYTINVKAGDNFEFLSIVSANGAFKYFGSLPAFIVTGNSEYNFALDHDIMKKFTVSGTVSFNGAPVSGAVVTYMINGIQNVAVTNSSGVYSIIVSSGDNFAFVSILSSDQALKYFGTLPSFIVESDSTHNFVLQYNDINFTVSGTVTFNGSPVSGAVVTYRIGTTQYTAYADASGRYSIAVHAGDQFAFVSVTSSNEALKYFGTLTSFTVLGNSVHDFALNYDTSKRFTVSGTVSFNGSPLSGAVVTYRINGVQNTAVTNSLGRYSIDVYSGDNFVFVSIVSQNGAFKFFGTLPTFTVDGDSVHDFPLDYDRTKKFTVSGTITFEGAPVANAVVTYTIGGVSHTVYSDASGRYSIDVYSGDVFAFVSIVSQNGALKYIGTLPSFIVTSDMTYDFVLDYDITKKFTVSGTVTFNSNPVSGAIVTYRINGVQNTAVTNSSGNYAITVSSGDNFVFVSVTSANEALRYFGTLSSFRVIGDSVHNFALDYDTSKKFTVSGTVTFNGSPVSGAVVTYRIGTTQFTAYANASGVYSITVSSGDQFAFV
ncbi:MAG: hypothetical protein FWG58_04925, partial [Methanomassiliicoccaceae archaeon]|nr:hypothetical protein [Methanomassiliicoccaceae archaeon]